MRIIKAIARLLSLESPLLKPWEKPVAITVRPPIQSPIQEGSSPEAMRSYIAQLETMNSFLAGQVEKANHIAADAYNRWMDAYNEDEKRRAAMRRELFSIEAILNGEEP